MKQENVVVFFRYRKVQGCRLIKKNFFKSLSSFFNVVSKLVEIAQRKKKEENACYFFIINQLLQIYCSGFV